MPLKPLAILVMEQDRRADVYPDPVIARLDEMVTLQRPFHTRESLAHCLTLDPTALAETRLLFTSWGAPRLDAGLLSAMPRLEAVFHAAGSVKTITTDEFWQAGIPMVSAASANAVPVAEFAVAQILLGLKQTHRLSREIRDRGAFPPVKPVLAGAAQSTVGLLSLGEIGSAVASWLQSTSVRVIAHDPMVSPDRASRLGVELVGLEKLFAASSVVSIHTPLLPQTHGLVTGRLVSMLPEGATLLNTARGAVIEEAELVEVLGRRPDLTAVLDVTWPEPPLPGSALYTLPNVVLTPHISGAMGVERGRMGQLVAREAGRWVHGVPLNHAVRRDRIAHIA
ncbi:hydroxyacid dehydrogenase [Psychromicrobium xiongbiense]|uniref:hydroxyacid dehydrogenase n=1 Tax=Psychromicrobium xiongbiense TaxID=3051184 RepID=UPI0025557C10|nr:hydroxyacid dehydrogenase [Psychromicrobium sp. YIM S02556]